MIHELSLRKNIKTFSICPENPTGGKGMGGTSVHDERAIMHIYAAALI